MWGTTLDLEKVFAKVKKNFIIFWLKRYIYKFFVGFFWPNRAFFVT